MRRLACPGLLVFLVPACGGYDGQAAGAGDEIGTTQQAVHTKCGAASNGPVQGVDVSYYQGNFNWAGAGVQFGYARVSDGTGFMDPQFSNNWSKTKAAGVLRGAYQFFEPGQDATAQANIVVNAVGKLGAGDLPAMIDVEATGGQSAGTIASKMQTWLTVVEKGTGKRPIIYTGPYFWQSNVNSGAFASYPLWIAHYGVSCPLIPDNWSNWTAWQHSDGGGSLDHDVFNGTLAQLRNLGVTNQPPRGYLDSADCKSIAGWSQDPDEPTKSIAVHVYLNGPAGAAGAIGVPLGADQNRQDLCSAIGSCNHGFSMETPRGLLDNQAHEVHAYGIDSAGGANAELLKSPLSFTCPPPTAPLDPAHGVKRWVTGPSVFSAWKFSYTYDVAHYPDSVVASYPDGPDFPASPEVVQADDGTPEVWVIDNGVRRHVINPASLAAWRFGAPKKMSAAQVYAYPQSTDFRPEPFLVMGNGPEAYVLDDPLSASGTGGAGGAGGTAGSSNSGGSGGSAGMGGAARGTSLDGGTTEHTHTAGGDGGGCGCRAGGAPGRRAPLWLGLGVLGFVLLRKRRGAAPPV